MATPQSISSQGSSKFRKYEQIVSQFCPECSNQLYPKEDVQRRKLLYVCRTCQYAEEAKSYCVYRNILNNSAAETAGVTQDVGSDPTLPRTQKACPKCHHEWAVFFQSQERSAETGMKLFYVCCGCGHKFV